MKLLITMIQRGVKMPNLWNVEKKLFVCLSSVSGFKMFSNFESCNLVGKNSLIVFRIQYLDYSAMFIHSSFFSPD